MLYKGTKNPGIRSKDIQNGRVIMSKTNMKNLHAWLTA
jgi:hypothetical protein